MFNSLIDIPISISEEFPNRVSHRFRSEKSFVDITYERFAKDIKALALGLNYFGIDKNSHVSFFVNNRYEWSLTDFSLQSLSAVSVPRGSDTSPKEAIFIYEHSNSEFLIVENVEQLSSIMDIAKIAKRIFIVDNGEVPTSLKDKTVPYLEVMERGLEILNKSPEKYDEHKNAVSLNNIVSIIYTSGTTGNPKGVILTQSNFLENVKMTVPRMEVDREVGEVTVTILPAWHVFERTFEYTGLAGGLSFVYSSLKHFPSDILREKPHVLASVPRVWESIYNKMKLYIKSLPKRKRVMFNLLVKYNFRYKKFKSILKKSYIAYLKPSFFKRFFIVVYSILNITSLFLLHLFAEKVFNGVREKVGGRLRAAISGGGSLPIAVDQFFESVGIKILNAYGMTECSPGIMSRQVSRNTIGTIGTPFDGTQAKIVDDKGKTVGVGVKGELCIKGPQVMDGYYKNLEATKDVLSDDGWLNTGDLAKETAYGDFVLVGRCKDTIVLLGGENIDPLPIEDKLQESEFIDHVMLLGQDKKGLTAFIALNNDTLKEFASDIKAKISDIFDPKSDDHKQTDEYKTLEKKIKSEVDKKITKDSGFRPFEKVVQVILVKNTFEVGKELTQTLKIKRLQIQKKYRSIIDKYMGVGS